MPRNLTTALVALCLTTFAGCDGDSFDEEIESSELDEHDDALGTQDDSDDEPVRTLPDAPPPGADTIAAEPDVQAGYWDGWQPIIQVKSGLCLDAAGSTPGTYVRQHWCHFGQRQQWKFRLAPDLSYFRIENQSTGLCLDNTAGYLTLQPCGIWPGQRFTVHDPSTPGLIAFESIADGECWDIPFGSNDPAYVNGSFLCNGQTNQQWVVAVPDSVYACGL